MNVKTLVLTALIAAIAFAGCGSSPKASGSDELDVAIRAASDYLNERIPAGSKIVILNVQSGSEALSSYIIDELIANAVNDGIFEVVDRQQLDLIRAEQNFQWAGEVDDNLALEVGKFFGAQSIVSGALSPLGSRNRLTVRALEVQTAQVQGQFNRNIDASATITDLMRSGGGSSGGAATASGGRPSGAGASGTTQTAAATPARPTAPKNGTYTFWPRPRATKAGMPAHWYLDKVIVGGNYMTVCVSSTARGVADYGGGESRSESSAYWFTGGTTRDCYLDSEDIPGRMWQPIKVGWQDSTYGGVYMVFENVVGKHFTIRGETHKPPLTMDIVLGEPDE